MNKALVLLLSDLLSTIVFLVLFAVTGSALVTTIVAIGVGAAQIGFEKWRGKKVEAMQWLSLGLVLVFGGAALVTHDNRFILVKPTLIRFAVGAVMLKRGWLDRYLPAIVHQNVPARVIVASGYAWASSMFVLGLVNLWLAFHGDVRIWALFNSVAPLTIEFGGFALQYLIFRRIVARQLRRAALSAA